MNGIFDLKVGFLLHHMLALFFWFYYMFNVYEKPNFYFTYYGTFVTFKHDSFFLFFGVLKHVPKPMMEFGGTNDLFIEININCSSIFKVLFILALIQTMEENILNFLFF